MSIYLFEGYLISKKNSREVNEKKKEIILKQQGFKYDKRNKMQVYKDEFLKNKNTSVTITPKTFNDTSKKIHFLSGKSNSYTIGCNENGYYSSYLSDRYGFNNPNETWDEDKIEYLIVGDSFAHGECVSDTNDIGSIIRNISKKTVLNLGYKGNGPLSMLASLKEYAPNNFKNLLWLYFEGNDLDDLTAELEISILKKYYTDNNFFQNLKNKQSYIDKQVDQIILDSIKLEDQIYSENKKNSKLKYKILKFIRLDNSKEMFFKLTNKNIKKKNSLINLKKILILVKKFTEEKNVNLYFVYLPQYERYKKKIFWNDNNYKEIKKIMHDLNIKTIDINSEIFEKEKEPTNLFPFGMWGHYNEEGYKKIAEKIYKLSLN